MTRNEFISAGIGSLSAFGAAMAFMFSNFETVDAANQRWADHNQAIVCKTVNDLRMEQRRIKSRLEFDDDLSEQQRNLLKDQINEIRAEINKKDPSGKC